MLQTQTFSKTFSDYQIIKQLGRGSYGTAFEAKCKLTQRIVVIKIISIRSMKANARKGAFREVSLMKTLSHPNIIKYKSSFFDENNLYIAMEYAEKGDLSQVMFRFIQLIKSRRQKNSPFTQHEIWNMVTQMLEGLQYLHSKSIIHRDIKPSNIFIAKDGTLKVIYKDIQIGDLGVSKILTREAIDKTRIGTPLYLAPQLIRHESYDFKVDVWGLGCVLYLLATLEYPFHGKNIFQLGQSILKDQPKAFSYKYSDSLQKLIRQMLEKNSRLRPSCQNILSNYHLLNINCKSQNQSRSSTKFTKTLSQTKQLKNELIKIQCNNENFFEVLSCKKRVLEVEPACAGPDTALKVIKQQERNNRGSINNTKKIDSLAARSVDMVKAPLPKVTQIIYALATEPDQPHQHFNNKAINHQPVPTNIPEIVTAMNIARRPMSAAIMRNSKNYNPPCNGITLSDLLRITYSKKQTKQSDQSTHLYAIKSPCEQFDDQQQKFEDEQVKFTVNSFIRPMTGVQNSRNYKHKLQISEKGMLCMSKSFIKPKCPTIELKRPDIIAIAYSKPLQN